jgi:hypothetical protein
VLRVFLRTVFGWQRRCAARRGLVGVRSGSVTAIQRFGGSRTTIDWVGADRIVYALDFPRWDHRVKELQNRPDLTDAQKRGGLAENARQPTGCAEAGEEDTPVLVTSFAAGRPG